MVGVTGIRPRRGERAEYLYHHPHRMTKVSALPGQDVSVTTWTWPAGRPGGGRMGREVVMPARAGRAAGFARATAMAAVGIAAVGPMIGTAASRGLAAPKATTAVHIAAPASAPTPMPAASATTVSPSAVSPSTVSLSTGPATPTQTVPAGSGPPASPEPVTPSPTSQGTAPPVAPRPPISPAASSSPVSVPSLVIAALVLVGAAAAATRIVRRKTRGPATTGGERAAPGDRAAATASARPPDSIGDAVAFLVALGRAMIDSGEPVTLVEASLRRVALINGLHGAEIVVMPNAMFVTVPGDEDVHTAVTHAGRALRLDQIHAVFTVVDAAEAGTIDAETGLARLAAARAAAPPYRPALRLLGYSLTAGGLVFILRANAAELLTAVLLAAAVGGLQLYRGRIPAAYVVFLLIGSSFAVSLAVFLLMRAGLPIGPYPPLAAALVTLLPGSLLTTAVIELATGQMSGAGRLAQGVTQLVLLSIGIVAAGQLVGVPTTAQGWAPTGAVQEILPWLGVAIFAVGAVLANNARPSSLRWIMLLLYVAYAGQVLGGFLFGPELSAFTGALVMTPVAMIVANLPAGPPPLVTFLPAFWLLVPGAMSLAGVAKYLGEDRVDGLTSLVSAGSAMLGITFGVLLGLAAGSFAGLGRGISPASPGPDRSADPRATS